jgi:dienelactone hydrolase
MRRTAHLGAAIAITLLIGAGRSQLSRPVHAAGSVDAAFDAFWKAPDPKAAEKTIGAIVASGVDFDAAVSRLKAGRTFAKEKTGLLRIPQQIGGEQFETLISIPPEYDPSKKWEVRVQLHGGVGRAPQPGRMPQATRIPGEPQIYIEPQASDENAWWHATQVDNILALVDMVKRKYNVDETHTYITGISDGGTGTYFFALREANLWSSCMTINGQPLVLSNRDARIDGNLYLGNLVNCPLYIENGDHDPLYPAESVTPLVDAMHHAGVSPVYHIMVNDRHDTHWWPQERAFYETFMHEHPRVPNPDKLSWETDRTDRFNRLRWLVIDKLGVKKSDKPLQDVNVFTYEDSQMNVFPRKRQTASGRVDITRKGNAFEAQTRGVSDFTLLLSPDAVDFAKPVQVSVNGQQVFSGSVKTDLQTLLKWAARDNDRTTLYGAELHIAVP